MQLIRAQYCCIELGSALILLVYTLISGSISTHWVNANNITGPLRLPQPLLGRLASALVSLWQCRLDRSRLNIRISDRRDQANQLTHDDCTGRILTAPGRILTTLQVHSGSPSPPRTFGKCFGLSVAV